MTSPYASLSLSMSDDSSDASAVQRSPAAFKRAASSAVAARDFGNPATMASSDAPIAPARAAADPPPGVGSRDRKASSRLVTVRSVSFKSARSQLPDYRSPDYPLADDYLTTLDHACDRCDPNANQVDGITSDQHGVHEFTGFEAADGSVAVERVRAGDGRCDERFFECQPHPEARQRHGKRHRR